MWKFKIKARDDENTDPYGEEFYTTETLHNISNALVRETIQNSLDARVGKGPIRVRFAFSSERENLDRQKANKYLDGLAQHLQSCSSHFSELPDSGEKMNFLVIEDFGTRGLCGNPLQEEDPDSANRSGIFYDFYYFWRNTGRSNKREEERGRWGLGKFVFPSVSRVRTYFGITVRSDDGRCLLLGKSFLKIHKCDGITYHPYGYYGTFLEDYFAHPIEENSRISAFRSDFRLKRAQESGLSVVIPYPSDEVQPDDVIESAVRQYFFPILRGNLVVEVLAKGEEYILDNNNIFEALSRKLDTTLGRKETLQKLFALARWAIDFPGQDYKETNLGLDWKEDLFSGNLLANLREKFKYGEKIALQVPMRVQKAGSGEKETYFRVFLERDKDLDTDESYYIREDITITGIKSGLQKGVRGIVLVEDKPLATLLGDSENPAHTEWQERSAKFKNRYMQGPKCLRFVKNSLREIVRILSGPVEGRDEDLLRDIFFIELSPDEDSRDKQKETSDDKPGNQSEKPKPPRTQSEINIQVTSINGGFSLSRVSDKNLVGFVVTVTAAYEVRRGNAFSRYHPADFEMSSAPIRIETSGVDITEKRKNILEFRVLEPEFKVKVTGFDLHRDLRVKAEAEERET